MTDTTGPEPCVLIVGAGPTGLTLACDLARRNIPLRVIDAAPGPQPGSRGKGIQPRTLEVFEDLGIAGRVIEHGRMAMTIRTTAADGSVVVGGAEPESLSNRPDIPYTTSLITPQWRVEQALRQRLAEFGGHVEFDTTLTAYQQSQDGVAVELRSDDRPETVRVRWLVGCDGGHSTVRKHAGISFSGETRESVRMIVADLEVEGLDRDAWHMWRHRDGMVSLCPLPSTSVFQYQAGIAPGQDPDLCLANMQDILDRRAGRTDVRLLEPSWASLWRANVRLVDRYRENRVLLAGDAAHIHSPAGGQGMNTGIQDAYNLGWKIAAVIDGATPALLDSYESERRPVAAGVLALSDERLRQTLQDNAVPITRDVDTTQLRINYRGSCLAHDDRDDSAAVRAGDRAPDATHLDTTDGERRLFDLIRGTQFALLDFAGSSAARSVPGDVRFLDVSRIPSAAGQVTDTRGHLASAFGATARSLVLIRPDGYIAVISDSGETQPIVDYLAAVHRQECPPDG